MTGLNNEQGHTLLNDADAVYESFKRHEAAIARFGQDEAKLLEELPHHWVAVGASGLVAWGESAEEVMQAVAGQGLSGSDVTLEYLDPEPPSYLPSGRSS